MACRRLRIWTPVVSWNAKAADRWGVRGDKAQGKHLMNLDIGLPVEQLRNPIRRYLTSETPGTTTRLTAINRRGRNIHVDITGSPLRQEDGNVSGVVLIMQEADSGADNQSS